MPSFITECDNVKRHKWVLDQRQIVLQNGSMAGEPEYPYWEQGRRLRWLRQAERIDTGVAFAIKYGWPQSGISQFETGKRQVPGNKARQLAREIAGFDPMWLWTGEKRGLGFDLRMRIEAEEAKEACQSARDER